MLKNRTNKQKFAILTAGIVVLIWFSYQFSFSKTIDLWKEHKRLKNQQALIKDIPEQLPVLTSRLSQLENILGQVDGEDFSALILDQVNKLCQQNNIVLKEIPEKHLFNGINLIVETLDINLQGRFSELLLVILQLEKRETGVRLRSIKLQSVVNQTTGVRSLQSTLFLQSLRLISSNSNTSGYEKIDN